MSPGSFQRRKKDASSSSSQAIVVHEPSTRVREATPESYGFSLREASDLNTFNQLKIKEWKGTRHLDLHLLDILGILPDIEMMVSALGWEQFLSFSEPTYKGLTLEFLSTLHAQIREGPNVEDGVCTFQLGGSKRTLTLNDINRIFGFREVGVNVPRCESRAVLCKNSFWSYIATGPPYNPSYAKASYITNPAIRVFQRFMAHTIFGRADGENNCPRKELVVIETALRRRPINSAGFLMSHLSTVSRRGKGGIAIGGIVTKIARHFQIPLGKHPDIESVPLNYIALHHMRFLYRHDESYYWLIGSSKMVMLLPNVERTCLSNEANWSVGLRKEDLPVKVVNNRKRLRGLTQAQEEAQAEEAEEENEDDDDDDEADDMDYVPEQMYHDPRFDLLMQSVSGLRAHVDEQFRLLNERQDEQFRVLQERQEEHFRVLNARFDAWNANGGGIEKRKTTESSEIPRARHKKSVPN